MVVSSPLDGTLALSGSKDVNWAITWDADPTGSFVGGALVFRLSLGTLTLTPTTPLPVALTGAESTRTVHLAHKRLQTQAAFAAAVQTALDGLLPGSDILVTPAGANLQIHSNLGSGNAAELICLLSDEQVKGTAELKSASPWLSTGTGENAPLASFTCGPVVLPKDVHTVYLQSDVLAGARDTMGPVMGQRGTVAVIPLGSSEHGDRVHESVYRPHLFPSQARTDITRVDFKLVDSRGVTLDTQGHKVVFTCTFDTSHMLA